MVSGFLISALGGSRVCVGGPTAAFIPILLGVAHTYGTDNLVVCTAMSGLMLAAMGALGLGTTIKFIPKPVVTGFTAGIATYIFSTQIKVWVAWAGHAFALCSMRSAHTPRYGCQACTAQDFLGLGTPGALPEGTVVPSEFLEKVRQVLRV